MQRRSIAPLATLFVAPQDLESAFSAAFRHAGHSTAGDQSISADGSHQRDASSTGMHLFSAAYSRAFMSCDCGMKTQPQGGPTPCAVFHPIKTIFLVKERMRPIEGERTLVLC